MLDSCLAPIVGGRGVKEPFPVGREQGRLCRGEENVSGRRRERREGMREDFMMVGKGGDGGKYKVMLSPRVCPCEPVELDLGDEGEASYLYITQSIPSLPNRTININFHYMTLPGIRPSKTSPPNKSRARSLIPCIATIPLSRKRGPKARGVKPLAAPRLGLRGARGRRFSEVGGSSGGSGRDACAEDKNRQCTFCVGNWVDVTLCSRSW